eukprot:Blabericola_migrator_1__5140@NODE_2655_length_2489_cov_481_968208_g1664_i0_p1_GENE_NODE_2655_length_2489_cov_481_968208_g1664_i0NODE_2655_length_2489_cov_481_968208_g1664_i0_p1_ORF_typecomplete_len571_score76_52DUF900/PF05990_12/5_4e28Abhydrolase_6/PF12697_7/0_014LCAT/PF02450_15/0_2_NODE_2655_length_2489_cov_481_968208_g1664_i07762467
MEASESIRAATRILVGRHSNLAGVDHTHDGETTRRRQTFHLLTMEKPELQGQSASFRTIDDCNKALEWVTGNMMPYHIPPSFGEAQGGNSVRIVLDPRRGLLPVGWTHVRSSARRSTIMSQLAEEHTGGDTSPLSPMSIRSNSTSIADRMPSSSLVIQTVETYKREASLTSALLWKPSDYFVGDKSLEIGIEGWRRMTGDSLQGVEAILFIHGYKTPLNEAPLLLGQLIALGGFPNNIKPFMFLWPAGIQVWHYYQARRSSHHYLCQRALVLVLKSLASVGIRDVHIMVHSMGSRLFLNSLKYAEAEQLFIQKGNVIKGGGPPLETRFAPPPEQLNLINLIFIHPEQYLDEFVTGGGYEAAKRIADLITIYCHSNDEALMSAEILSKGRKCMGRHPFGYIRSLPKQRKLSSPTNKLSTTASPDSNVSVGDKTHKNVQSNVNALEVDAPPVDRFGLTRPPSIKWRPSMSDSSFSSIFGEHVVKKDDVEYEWLDLDVIDCTYLEANVHNLKHCFFNINASVVGDLRELLTQKTRASQRHQLLERRDGNVYTFRVPPAQLRSIFGV